MRIAPPVLQADAREYLDGIHPGGERIPFGCTLPRSGNWGRKNKCGSGQPPKPHCYRECSDCHLPPKRKIIAQPHSEERSVAMRA